MTHHSFTVPGKPVAKQRPRFTLSGRAYTPKPTKEYQRLVATHAKEAGVPCIEDGAIALSVVVWLEWPKSYHRKRKPCPECWHARKPDLDNILKSVKDALNKVCWADDGQVAKVYAQKRYLPQNNDHGEHVVVCYGRLSEC